MMSNSGAKLFNHTCFNYPTFGDLYLYKYATYEAMLKRDDFVADEDESSAPPDIPHLGA